MTEAAEIDPVITLLETTEQIDGFFADKMKNTHKIGLYPIRRMEPYSGWLPPYPIKMSLFVESEWNGA